MGSCKDMLGQQWHAKTGEGTGNQLQMGHFTFCLKPAQPLTFNTAAITLPADWVQGKRLHIKDRQSLVPYERGTSVRAVWLQVIPQHRYHGGCAIPRLFPHTAIGKFQPIHRCISLPAHIQLNTVVLRPSFFILYDLKLSAVWPLRYKSEPPHNWLNLERGQGCEVFPH